MRWQVGRSAQWQCLVLLLISLWWQTAAIHHDYHVLDADYHQAHQCALFSAPALLADAPALVPPQWRCQPSSEVVFAAVEHQRLAPKARDPPTVSFYSL